MTVGLIGAGVVVIVAVVVWLCRPLSARDNVTDGAWRPTGYRLTTEGHYDQAQAIRASKRARGRSETGRPLPRPTPASVTDIQSRKRA